MRKCERLSRNGDMWDIFLLEMNENELFMIFLTTEQEDG
jgi:hypothetical protein